MQPSFKPPKTEEEFKQRAEKITVANAKNMISILNSRREQAVKAIDQEILFFKKVIGYKSKEGA